MGILADSNTIYIVMLYYFLILAAGLGKTTNPVNFKNEIKIQSMQSYWLGSVILKREN